LLGETYRGNAEEFRPRECPQLWVVFPHCGRDLLKDGEFLKAWHDHIVKPAFEKAWEESGLLPASDSPGDANGQGMHSQSDSVHPSKAMSFDELLKHVTANERQQAVRTRWPEWIDQQPERGYSEGPFSDKRAKVYNDAWTAMKKMLNQHKKLKDPILLCINRSTTEFGLEMPLHTIYDRVGQQWNKSVDARFVVPRTFKVVVETVIGDVN
jgi:hypothetical protein